MPTQIVLIRHGETAWNAERRLQGHIDIALNAEGLRQAEALAGALAGERIDAIISSDLQRAAQTAHALARRRDMPVASDPALRERCFGGFEGLLYAEIDQRFPREFAAWQARDIDGVMPDGARVAKRFGHPRAFPVMNASINRFSMDDGKLTLLSWGEVDHLQRGVLDELK